MFQLLKSGVPLVLPVVVAVLGWFVVNWLSAKQKIKDDKRKLRLDYMINAYGRLCRFETEGLNTDEDLDNFRTVVNNIHLFGTKEQVDAIRALVSERTEKGSSIGIPNLFKLLVKEIRGELGMEFFEDKLGLTVSRRGDTTRKMTGATQPGSGPIAGS
jgi:hypothetical protein